MTKKKIGLKQSRRLKVLNRVITKETLVKKEVLAQNPQEDEEIENEKLILFNLFNKNSFNLL